MPISILLIATMGAIASESRPASDVWEQDDLGQVAVFQMASAPFPHKSREDGFKINGKFFPREPHYTDNSVAIFIPSGYRPQKETDLLIYFHGHYGNVLGAMEEFKLREQVVAAGRNVIFVFPEGPKNAEDSGGGRLEEPDALKALVAEVLDTLVKTNRIPTRQLGRVLLAGHSGAYRVISFCLEHGGLENHVVAACLLDSSYARLNAFVDWAVRDSKHRLFSIFTDHLATENLTMMTQLRKKAVAYDLLEDDDATDENLRDQRLLFLYTRKLKHGQTVRWLQRWLKTVPLAAESQSRPAPGGR